MKYNSLKKTKEKIISIPFLDGGINFSANQNKIENNQLTYAKNVICNEDIIKTRLGLSGNSNGVLDISQFSDAYYIDFKVTDTEVFIDGNYGKIAFGFIDYGDSNIIYKMFFISSNSSQRSIGEIYFGRVDSETFYIPTNITFYSGFSSEGSGIFAFVSLANMYNSLKKEYRIYELDNTFEAWSHRYSYYIPTIYINGRGNAYETAVENNYISQNKPTELESLNMLDGRFYAYYSSDGFSNSFKLPFSQISEESVVCRIYYTLQDYAEWIVYMGSDSATTTFNGKNVTMNVNREKGVVYFTYEQANFAIPTTDIYKENNIRILAKKDIEDSFSDVVSCGFSKPLDSRIIFAGGQKADRIYYCDYENPLYFPITTNNTVGTDETSVKALTNVGDKVYIFKGSSIYTVSLSKGKNLSSAFVLRDNDSVFKTPDSFDIRTISNKTNGCKNNTIAVYNNLVFWQGEDSNIYSVSSSGKIINLSEKCKEFLKMNFSQDEIFADFTYNNYFLCCDNKAFIMVYKENNPTWYFWEFPEEIKLSGLIFSNGDIAFLCRKKDTSLAYTAKLEGEADVCISPSFEEIRYNIKSYIKTKSFNLNSGYIKKRINRVILKMAQKGKSKIRIGTDKDYIEFNLNPSDISEENLIDLITNLYGLNTVSISVSSDKVINLVGADIYYI